MVVSTWPDTFATIEPSRDPAVIRFSERISERPTVGRLNDAVLVSPETGDYRVKHTRSGLQVTVLGGFRPGLVYRIRVMNTIKDLFNNAMESPFEWVFSTGGTFEEHVIAGIITDRITGESVDQARVEARRVEAGGGEEGGAGEEEGGAVYVAKTDTAGIFLLRYVPAGEYGLSVFVDNNRNREPDFRELQGDTVVRVGAIPDRPDTVISRVSLLQPDTTPARLIRAEAEDSTLVRLEFDDFLMPGPAPLEEARVLLFEARPTSPEAEEEEEPVPAEEQERTPGPAVQRLLWPYQFDSLRAYQDSVVAADSLARVADSLRGVADSLQTVVADLRALGDTVDLPGVEGALERLLARLEPPEPELPTGGEVPAQAPPPILPQSLFYVILAEPLIPNRPYDVTVENLQNINGLREGGGEAAFGWEPPEPPPGDTAGVQADSLAVPPDTASTVRSRGRAGPRARGRFRERPWKP